MAREDHEIKRWTIGDFEIQEVIGWWIKRGEPAMFRYRLAGEDRWNVTAFYTLDMCVAAALAAKYTGHQGASGTGVGTAADWFAKMIGLEDKPQS